MRTAIYIIAFIVLSLGLAFTIRATDIDFPSVKKEKKDKKDKDDKSEEQKAAGVAILNKHEVPPILREISAIVYLSTNRFACVQDELGKIFIYNTAESKIEKEISFADPGDFEGLAIAGSTAYALRSDGQIVEVKDFLGVKPTTRVFTTHLTAENDTEGLCYDAANKRLLVAIKGVEASTDIYKGIYAFSLTDYTMNKTPVYKIELDNPVFAGLETKKSGSKMQPSAIAIHPKTGDIYIAEATSPKLLILDRSGKPKSLKQLSSKQFYKPEGISFSPEGTMYISNEGKKQPGNILEVNLQ